MLNLFIKISQVHFSLKSSALCARGISWLHFDVNSSTLFWDYEAHSFTIHNISIFNTVKLRSFSNIYGTITCHAMTQYHMSRQNTVGHVTSRLSRPCHIMTQYTMSRHDPLQHVTPRRSKACHVTTQYDMSHHAMTQ